MGNAIQKTAGRHGVIVMSLLVLAVLFGGLITDENHQISRQRYGGFRTFYEAAGAVRSNRSPYTRSPGRYSYVYPPLFACLLTPMVRLPIGQAARVMMAIDAASILGALVLIVSAASVRFFGRVRVELVAPVVASTALFLIVPIHNELKGLETNAIVMLCFAAGLFFADGMPLLAGLALAFAVDIKYLPLVLIPYFVVRRRWALLICTLGSTLVLALLPALVVGWSANLRYLSTAVGGLTHLAGGEASASFGAQVPQLTHGSSVSITSGLARLAADHRWPRGLVAASAAVIVIAVLVVAWGAYRKQGFGLLGWPNASSQRVAPYRVLVLLEWTWIIGILLALGPNTQDRLLILVAFPTTLFFTVVWSEMGRSSVRLIAGGLTLFCAVTLPVSWMGFTLSHAWKDVGIPGWLVLAGTTLIITAALDRMPARAAITSEAEAPSPGRLPAAVRY